MSLEIKFGFIIKNKFLELRILISFRPNYGKEFPGVHKKKLRYPMVCLNFLANKDYWQSQFRGRLTKDPPLSLILINFVPNVGAIVEKEIEQKGHYVYILIPLFCIYTSKLQYMTR